MLEAYTAWHDSSSWARHGRQFFEALALHEEVRVWAFDSDPEGTARFLIRPGITGRSQLHDSRIAIGIGPFRTLERMKADRGIAFIAFESTYLPPNKVELLSRFRRVWVPSHWGKAILIQNGLRAEMIDVVPEGVDVRLFQPRTPCVNWKSQLSRALSPFRFLAVGKWEVRKNIDGLVLAFSRAFRPHDPVELVLHCTNQFAPFDYAARVEWLTRGIHPRITLSSPCEWRNLPSLYHSADAFVLPTRAEGWGLPILEAMASGLPVIITKYGAPLEFTSPESAYYIDVEALVPINDQVFYAHDTEGKWAEPSVRHAGELLRHVYKHRDEAREKGMNGRRLAVDKWTWNHAAGVAVDRLKTLS